MKRAHSKAKPRPRIKKAEDSGQFDMKVYIGTTKAMKGGKGRLEDKRAWAVFRHANRPALGMEFRRIPP